MSAFSSTTLVDVAPVYQDPPHPHIYLGDPRRWCRLIIPGRTERGRLIELDDGTRLDVSLNAVQLTIACQVCSFTGKITRQLEPKEPAVVTTCQRCKGLKRHPMPRPQLWTPLRDTEAVPADDDEPRRAAPVGRQRVDLTRPTRRTDWERQRPDRSDWS